MASIAGMLAQIYSPKAAAEWLETRQRLLDNKVPSHMLRDGEIDRIREMLEEELACRKRIDDFDASVFIRFGESLNRKKTEP